MLYGECVKGLANIVLVALLSAIVATESGVGSHPEVAVAVFEHGLDAIAGQSMLYGESAKGLAYILPAVVATESGVGCKPEIAVAVLQDRRDPIASQSIFDGEILKIAAVVAADPTSNGSDPEVAVAVFQQVVDSHIVQSIARIVGAPVTPFSAGLQGLSGSRRLLVQFKKRHEHAVRSHRAESPPQAPQLCYIGRVFSERSGPLCEFGYRGEFEEAGEDGIGRCPAGLRGFPQVVFFQQWYECGRVLLFEFGHARGGHPEAQTGQNGLGGRSRERTEQQEGEESPEDETEKELHQEYAFAV